jgi:hypothetical protein
LVTAGTSGVLPAVAARGEQPVLANRCLALEALGSGGLVAGAEHNNSAGAQR